MTIYVLRSNGMVKIGFTEHLRTRITTLKVGIPAPSEFVGHMPGDKEVEAHLHWAFAAHRFEGEWFIETDEMGKIFAVLLDPELPMPSTPKEQKRVGSDKELAHLSNRLREWAAHRWPLVTQGERIKIVAAELGWNRNRTKDLFYADPRIAVRGFELDALRALLGAVDRSGTEG